MSEGMRPIARNALALLLAYVIPRAFMLAGVAAAARVLGAESFGRYGTAAALAVILSIVSTLGMQPLLVRELARGPDRADDLLRSAHAVKTAANALMLALLGIAAVLLGFPPPVLATALVLGLAYAVGSYAENLGAWFQSQERMHVWTLASALFGVVAGLGGALAVVATGSMVAFAGAALAGQLAALGWLGWRWRREASPRASIAARTVAPAQLGRAVLPFALAFLALTLYGKLDVLLLARWRAAAEVGLYTAAYKFVDVTQALVIVGAGAVLPRLARALRPGTAGARTVELAFVTAVPCAGLVLLLREPLVTLVFGPEYARAVPALALLAAALPALALNLSAGYVLGVAGRMQLVAGAYAAALAARVGLCALLIPAWGAAGAAGAALAAEWTLAALLLFGLARAGARVGGRALALGGAGAVVVAALAVLP